VLFYFLLFHFHYAIGVLLSHVLPFFEIFLSLESLLLAGEVEQHDLLRLVRRVHHPLALRRDQLVQVPCRVVRRVNEAQLRRLLLVYGLRRLARGQHLVSAWGNLADWRRARLLLRQEKLLLILELRGGLCRFSWGHFLLSGRWRRAATSSCEDHGPALVSLGHPLHVKLDGSSLLYDSI
jgi:hypothetical protein